MTWASADISSRRDLQGSSATPEEELLIITSVNKVVHQLISRIIVWLLNHCGSEEARVTTCNFLVVQFDIA
jgi:hypothetical protein